MTIKQINSVIYPNNRNNKIKFCGNINYRYKEDKSNNDKFDSSECIKNFTKGIVSPLAVMLKHPLVTAGMIGATALTCSFIPVLGPILTIGFGALSVGQVGKNLYDVSNNYIHGNYDEAEKLFTGIGEGFIGTILSAIGLKQGGQIAKEAKLMNKLQTQSLDTTQKEIITHNIKNSTEGLKEILSLFTTKAGLKSVAYQFKPSMIKTRTTDLFNILSGAKKEEIVKTNKIKFSETKEGIRRAHLTTEEITQEANVLFEEVCNQYGIPQNLRPKLVITSEDIHNGGGYNCGMHTITINERAYREGVFDLPAAIKHEATHAQKAILIQRLPESEKSDLAIQYLSNKILHGENENIISDISTLGIQTMRSPKLTPKLTNDFLAFAKAELYNQKNLTLDDCTNLVKTIVEANPDFISKCGSKENALKIMGQYAKSHHTRYLIAINQGFNTNGINLYSLEPLTGNEKQIAIHSFNDGIECREGNAAFSAFAELINNYNQYQFSAEEVMAEKEGNLYEINKLKVQLDNLRSKTNFDKLEESRLLDLINRCELIIEYKTKGLEYYKLYTESLNHPHDIGLLREVARKQAELETLQEKFHNILKIINNPNGNSYVETLNYFIEEGITIPQKGATTMFPLATLYRTEN